jgi:hypothetical protein
MAMCTLLLLAAIEITTAQCKLPRDTVAIGPITVIAVEPDSGWIAPPPDLVPPRFADTGLPSKSDTKCRLRDPPSWGNCSTGPTRLPIAPPPIASPPN